MATLFRKILVPHDFSAHATRALKLAAALAAERRGRLVVLNVIQPFVPAAPLPPSPELIPWIPSENFIESDRRRLQGLVARTLRGRRGVRAECRVVVGDPLDRIVDAARRADSIVMATTGRTGLSHLLIGSVAEKVVRHAPVPVLTIRASAARARTPARKRRTSRRRVS